MGVLLEQILSIMGTVRGMICYAVGPASPAAGSRLPAPRMYQRKRENKKKRKKKRKREWMLSGEPRFSPVFSGFLRLKPE